MSRYDVCMVVHNNFVSDSRVEKEAAFLAAEGLRVKVFAIERKDLPSHEIRRGFEVERLQRYRFSVGRYVSGPNAGTVRKHPPLGDYIRYILNIALYQFRATLALVKCRPKVIHSHDLSGLQPGFVASKILRSKLIYDSHELWLRRQIIAKRRFAKYHNLKEKMMERLMIGSADRVITVSESIADTLKSWYGIKRPIVLVNGSEETQPRERREIGEHISGTGPLCVYVGGRNPGRGLENQVRALALLKGVRLVMIGSGAAYFDTRLRKLAKEAGCAERLFILPSVPGDQLLDWIASADIGLVTTEPVCLNNRFSLPNKIFQYAMAGVPVVASDFPDIARVVNEYALGGLCDPEDPESIAEQIRLILNGQTPTLDEKRRSEFRSVFSWAAQQSRLRDIYIELGVL